MSRNQRKRSFAKMRKQEAKQAAQRQEAATVPRTQPTTGDGASQPIPVNPIATMDSSTSADVRLINRAVGQRWPIKDAVRPAIANEMSRLALRAEREETRVRAAGALISMDRQNLEQEKLEAGLDGGVKVQVNNVQVGSSEKVALKGLSDEQIRLLMDATRNARSASRQSVLMGAGT